MSTPPAPDYATWARDLRAHADELEARAAGVRAAADELDELTPSPRRRAKTTTARRVVEVEVAAPFGHKADGTPRKRPAPTPAMQAKSTATRREQWRLKADTRPGNTMQGVAA